VQRIVVDEDADRPLRRQQVREVVDDVRQRMIGRIGIVSMNAIEHRFSLIVSSLRSALETDTRLSAQNRRR
jgi:hypothetical protein